MAPPRVTRRHKPAESLTLGSIELRNDLGGIDVVLRPLVFALEEQLQFRR
ncbi:MAG: hypothetical protein ACRD29_14545 [Acidimicrobiales bacterium]